jgi:hypothetical protein
MWDILTPIISNALAVIVMAAIGWLATTVQRKFNIEIEASYRNSLHSAVMSGVNAALSRIGGRASELPASLKVEVVDQAVAYAQKSVPDAIEALRATPEVLGSLASAKLGLIATAQTQEPSQIVVTPDTMGQR